MVFFVLLYPSIYLCLFFLDINDGNKGAQWRKEKKKTHAQNDRWRKTHLTPYIRIFIAHCAIINVILLISNHLLLPCHINRYRLFIRSNTFKSIYFVVFFHLLFSHHLSIIIYVGICSALVNTHFSQMCHCVCFINSNLIDEFWLKFISTDNVFVGNDVVLTAKGIKKLSLSLNRTHKLHWIWRENYCGMICNCGGPLPKPKEK